MSVRIDVSEVRALAARLDGISDRIEDRVAAAVRKTAFDIEGDAKILAPVDTGNLRSSISTDIVGISAEVGPTTEYGVFQELGTSEMGPQPYLGPAFDRRLPGFIQAVGRAADGAI